MDEEHPADFTGKIQNNAFESNTEHWDINGESVGWQATLYATQDHQYEMKNFVEKWEAATWGIRWTYRKPCPTSLPENTVSQPIPSATNKATWHLRRKASTFMPEYKGQNTKAKRIHLNSVPSGETTVTLPTHRPHGWLLWNSSWRAGTSPSASKPKTRIATGLVSIISIWNT